MPPTKPSRSQQIDALSKKNGLHSMIYLMNGDKYLGEWKDNLKHGNGTYYYHKTGSVYEGEWAFDQRNGLGTLSAPSSSISAKSFSTKSSSALSKTSKPQPKSNRPPTLQKIYAGEWKHDLRNGVGTNYYADGSVYDGEWANDLQQGWGRMTYTDGSVYVGQWWQGMRNGQGELLLPNGDRYEGTWLHDKKEGPGKFIFRQKRQIYEGEWSQDQPRCGALSDLPPLPGKEGRKYMIPKIGLENPNDILEKERQFVIEERLARLVDA